MGVVCAVGLLTCGRPVTAHFQDAAVPDGGDPPQIEENQDGGDGGTPCAITVEAVTPAPANHVPVGTAVNWNSNPPAGGSHYPIWAAYQEFTAAVPRGFYVHNLEHGAVVLLYNCASVDGSTCEAIGETLRQASAALPDDPLCASPVRVRTVITPDPLIPTPIAATAWGFVYRAECIDLPSLQAFVAAHYAKGPENLCTNGATHF